MLKTTRRFSAIMAGMLICAFEASAAAGDPAVWTDVTSRTAAWTDAGKWTDGAGAPLATAPIAGENVTIADLPALPAHDAYVGEADICGEQTITYATGSADPSIGTISGDARHTLRFGTDGDASDNTWADPQLKVNVGDPTDFLGFWLFGGMQIQLTTASGAGREHVFNNLTGKHRPVFKVDSADDVVAIGALSGGGALEKTGDGALRVKTTSGETSVTYLKGGKLILDGAADNALEALMAKAALHLDASDDCSLSKEAAPDGLISVRRWKDVRGEDGYYYFEDFTVSYPESYQIQTSNPPFLSPDAKSPTGLTLVDFGARGVAGIAEYPERGRTNCALRLGKDGDGTVRLTGVREVFYAVSCPKSAGSVQILGDSATFHYICSDETMLFDGTYSDPAVRHGDIIFNNAKSGFNGFDVQKLTDLYTLGVGVGRDTAVSYLGTRQLYASTTGGSRMGEILLFTNDLTRADRMMVCRYLDAKWRTGDTSKSDLTALHVASSSPTVEVPTEGNVARVGSLTAPDKVLNKTGDGTLVIGQMTDGMTINVQGGKVGFGGVSITDTAVAVNPYVHLDAESIGADDVEDVGDLSYVNTWKDENYGAERQATAALSGTSRPTLKTSALVGNRKIVDFGERSQTAGVGAWMKLCNWESPGHQAYAGFMVLRCKEPGSNPHFGSSNGMTFYRDATDCIIAPYYKNLCLGAALWRVNGATEDPFSSSSLNQTDRFVVLSFASVTPAQLDALVADKGGQSSVADAGGLEVGEVVVYDRPLTEPEFYSTEAYLMKKWLGVERPNEANVAEMTVGNDAAAELSSDQNLTIGRLTGGDGTIVKDGSGFVSVGSLSALPTAIAVKGGDLAVSLSAATFLDEATFHFDASRLDTLDYTVDGGVTNVNSWSDVRDNGWTALADSDELATQKPKLVTVESAPGSGTYIRALDFGAYSWKTNEYAEVNGSASMTLYKDGAARRNDGYQEVFCVFADAKDEHRASVIGDTLSHDFQRDWLGGAMYWQVNTYGGKGVEALKASSIVRNSGSQRLDGQEGVGGIVPTAGFHLFDYVCSNNGRNPVWDSGASIGAIARVFGSAKANTQYDWEFDYDIEWEDRGGLLLAEQLAFRRILTADEAAYVNALLAYKWFGGDNPGFLVTNAMTSVSVAAGATLALAAGDSTFVKTAALSGEGTVNVNMLPVTDKLCVTIANGKTEHLVVNGSIVFDGSLAVDVTADLSNGKIGEGLYPILTATDFVGFDETTFTVNVLTARSGVYSANVVRVGDTLYLRTFKSGSAIIIR